MPRACSRRVAQALARRHRETTQEIRRRQALAAGAAPFAFERLHGCVIRLPFSARHRDDNAAHAWGREGPCEPLRGFEFAATQFVEDRVEADFNSGVRSGVRGTPTFFINDEKLESEVPLAQIDKAYEAAMAKAK
jgi:hypothetical protein